MDFTTLGAFVVSIASFLGAVLAYLRGRRGDEALNLSTRMETLLGGQKGFIEDLRTDNAELRAYNEDLRNENEDLRNEVATLRRERDLR